MPRSGTICSMKTTSHLETAGALRGISEPVTALRLRHTPNGVRGDAHPESNAVGRTRRDLFKIAVAVLQTLVGICFFFSVSAEAAPKTVMQSLTVSAQVHEVDCSSRAVKKKACAPMVVATEMARVDNVESVVKTILYY